METLINLPIGKKIRFVLWSSYDSVEETHEYIEKVEVIRPALIFDNNTIVEFPSGKLGVFSSVAINTDGLFVLDFTFSEPIKLKNLIRHENSPQEL